MPADDKSSAFWQSAEYLAGEKLRALPRLLLGGDAGNATVALRESSSSWFPAFSTKETLVSEGGSESPYAKRVRMLTVEPFYEDAVARVVSAVLAEKVALGTDVPDKFRGAEDAKDGYTENVDLKGNNLDVWLKSVVKDAAGEGGFSVGLVDFPRVDGEVNGAEIERLRLRAYWNHFRARDVLLAEPEYINGRECLRELRVYDGKDADGDQQVRVITVAPWNEATGEREGFVTWRLVAQKKGVDGKLVEVENGRGTMEPHQEIPAHPLYFTKTGFYSATPGQSLLANLNMAHTEVTLDIRRDLALTSGASAVMKGAKTPEEKAQRVWDQDVCLVFESGDADAAWMERTGASATVYMQFQERLEDKCRSYAKLPLVQRSGNLTATGQSIDAAVARTEVQAYALAVKDFVEQLIKLTAIYINRSTKDPRGGTVTVKMPAILRERDIEGIKELADWRDRGILSTETLLETAIAASLGGLRDDLDVKAEIRKARAERGEEKAAVEAALAKHKGEQQTAPVIPADAGIAASAGNGDGGVQ